MQIKVGHLKYDKDWNESRQVEIKKFLALNVYIRKRHDEMGTDPDGI